MTMWDRVRSMPEDVRVQLQNYYGTAFPIEVRHYLADFIEQELLANPQYSEHEPEFQGQAAHFVETLIKELDRKTKEINEDNFTSKLRLNQAAIKFRELYSHNPSQLYLHLRKCLDFERYIICCPQTELNFVQDADITELTGSLAELHRMVRQNDYSYKQLSKDYEEFYIELHDFTKKQQQFGDSMNTLSLENRIQTQQVIAERKARLDEALSHITTKRLDLVNTFKVILTQTKNCQERVLSKYLAHWKITQSKAGNGAMPMNISSLDTIQSWCESLAELIWTTREAIRNVSKFKKQLGADEPNVIDFLPSLHTDVTNLLMNLITSTFVIEKQPPQVMKTNTRFASTVRLLIGNTLNIKMNSPVVKVSIVSESQAQIIQQTNKTTEPMACGEIINNQGNMEYNETTKQLSVSFRNMQLKKIKRAEKKGTESVMDEKFALLFQSNFAVGHGDIVFSVWALSLPVVVIVHGNQEPQSWATITWDNAFSDVSRVPFHVPEKVPWVMLADALTMKFKSATGKALSPENLHFLAEKAFKVSLPNPIPNDLMITWAQFCKEPLPDRTFTFWEWFYAAMKLTREHLRGPWNDGSIAGFIHKRTTEDVLTKCSRGTFLLRFSDSELGGITIAWVNEGDDIPPHVLHIQPFTAKDFATRALSDRIRDLDELTILYPHITKHDAFDRYSTPAGPPKNKDYIQSGIRAVLPTSSAQTPHSQISYPNTPASYAIQSPDPSRDTASVQSTYGPIQDESFVNDYEFDPMFLQ